MQLKHYAVVLYLLLPALAVGQNSANGAPLPQIQLHGIKIVSAKFDSATSPQTVQLDFINDSPANITAWGFCVNAQKVRESDPSQSFCTHVDPMSIVVDRQIQERITMRPIMGECADCGFIHPGEHKILSAKFLIPVVNAEMQVNLIIYSNGTAETDGQRGASFLQAVASSRRFQASQAQELLQMAKKILADSGDLHPAVSMINELGDRLQKEPALETVLRNFKRPGWRKTNDKEFIPDNEREYLGSFAKEQEIKVAEFAKYQIQGGGQ